MRNQRNTVAKPQRRLLSARQMMERGGFGHTFLYQHIIPRLHVVRLSARCIRCYEDEFEALLAERTSPPARAA